MIIIIAGDKEKLTLKKIHSELADDESEAGAIARDICDDYNKKYSELENLKIKFKEGIGCSAKTVDGNIFLNTTLLNEDFEVVMRYVIHELVHVFQHQLLKNKKNKNPDAALDYLNRPSEVEAFQAQIRYQNGVDGKAKAEDYVDDLIEYHKVDDKDKDDIKNTLLKDIN